jgi:hypothetical protein
MKRLIIHAILATLIMACKDQSRQSSGDPVNVKIENSKPIFSDSGKSSIELKEGSTKTIDVNYKIVSAKKKGIVKSYVAKITNSSIFFGEL